MCQQCAVFANEMVNWSRLVQQRPRSVIVSARCCARTCGFSLSRQIMLVLAAILRPDTVRLSGDDRPGSPILSGPRDQLPATCILKCLVFRIQAGLPIIRGKPLPEWPPYKSTATDPCSGLSVCRYHRNGGARTECLATGCKQAQSKCKPGKPAATTLLACSGGAY